MGTIIPISGNLISVDVMLYHYTFQLSQWQHSVRDSTAYEDRLGSSYYSFWKFSNIVVIAMINGLYDSLKILLLESPCIDFLWWCYQWRSIMICPLMTDLTDEMLKESAKEVIARILHLPFCFLPKDFIIHMHFIINIGHVRGRVICRMFCVSCCEIHCKREFCLKL